MIAEQRSILISLIIIVISSGPLVELVKADSINDKDFSLRFPASLNRFSSYADVAAAGGASAGSKWQTSVNPASSAWQSISGTYHLSLNPQYSAIVFNEGTVLHVISETATKDFQKIVTFELAGAHVRSNNSATRQGLNLSYEMDYLQVQWGKRFSDYFALGGNFNYASSEVVNSIDRAKFADSRSDTYGFRLGGLCRMAENLLGGLVVDYSWSPSKTTYYDVFGTGTGDMEIRDRTRQLTLRLGPSYEYRKDSTVNLDYQFSSIKNDTGTLEVHRLFAGIDHRIADALFVRGGLALDNYGNTSWTGGFGIYPLKNFSIDIGYQYNMFPEVHAEFGMAHTATISLGITL